MLRRSRSFTPFLKMNELVVRQSLWCGGGESNVEKHSHIRLTLCGLLLLAGLPSALLGNGLRLVSQDAFAAARGEAFAATANKLQHPYQVPPFYIDHGDSRFGPF